VSCQDGSFQPPQDWWCQETLGWLEQGIWLYDTLRSRFPTYLQQVVGQNGQHATSPKASLR
jgi:hypothetical protein